MLLKNLIMQQCTHKAAVYWETRLPQFIFFSFQRKCLLCTKKISTRFSMLVTNSLFMDSQQTLIKNNTKRNTNHISIIAQYWPCSLTLNVHLSNLEDGKKTIDLLIIIHNSSKITSRRPSIKWYSENIAYFLYLCANYVYNDKW